MTDQTPDYPKHPSSASDEEAIDWLIRFTEFAANSEGAPATARQEMQDEFNRWATQSSAHLRSFLEMASIFEALGECEAELIHELVAHVDSRGNIESLGLEPPANQMAEAEVSMPVVPPVQQRGKKVWRYVYSLAATLVLVGVGVFLWRLTAETTYRTQPGEWRRIRLEDGSVVILREESEILALFSGTTRRINLRRGHAVFDVAKDPSRPFFVGTSDAEIQALGTRFEVDDRNGLTRVTVVNGTVRVSAALLQANRALTLNDGQGAEVSSHSIVASDQSEVRSTLASQRDVLDFDRQQLSVVAERINLGSRKQLRFAGDEAGKKTISGRYMTDHPEGLALSIQEIYPELEVRETDDGWMVSKRATGGRAQ